MQISLHWHPANPGKALVIPLEHHENLYTLPDELAGRVARTVRRVAVAIRTGYSQRRGDGAAEQRAGRRPGRPGTCTPT